MFGKLFWNVFLEGLYGRNVFFVELLLGFIVFNCFGLPLLHVLVVGNLVREVAIVMVALDSFGRLFAHNFTILVITQSKRMWIGKTGMAKWKRLQVNAVSKTPIKLQIAGCSYLNLKKYTKSKWLWMCLDANPSCEVTNHDVKADSVVFCFRDSSRV